MSFNPCGIKDFVNRLGDGRPSVLGDALKVRLAQAYETRWKMGAGNNVVFFFAQIADSFNIFSQGKK
jgi:hypothetical protein